ncbi:hypothetical protein LEP1GSC043_3146 [Leptospira weilii str. Ecochallenge]|uniref:Uncharacterized protein n=1 Tax=Leptospira weilii str. Ecochallenge TaxID=1049986 RepID=N1U2D9_9LEPT|nr:hypothetical protein LEP1GSC043_3146 [Leptospira weilii str. Ecochallenge]
MTKIKVYNILLFINLEESKIEPLNSFFRSSGKNSNSIENNRSKDAFRN